ncbi:MAG: excinuclease ABC subunit UvrC [Rudaea sp.]|uniref:excinuclease ABC subunit UvrC n=1 Tax=unclassified Rudaea TaxID=2627037 RepID=UPI0010F8423E|nr:MULTISPECIES: excinuclease ABC subunit UvrC [unclassified Rudaea]MBN8886290.1 excinuclease ABC subunit UvrC [Rudaea sp.]
MSDSSTPAFDGKEFVRTLTSSPGVYRMFDARGDLLYVGKAGSLKKRVGSYFLKPRLEPRIMSMISQIARMETTLTRTEGEALLLEAHLIKSLKPRYNILLRDDKSYPYVYLSEGEDFPRIAFHRGAKSGKGKYFGPFPSAWAVRESLNHMQKIFLVRQCEDSYFRNRSRPCLQYQIGRCSAPCVGLIGKDEYQDSVRHAAMFLDGKSDAVIGELISTMERAAADLAFEKAARLRDQVSTLKRLLAKNYVQGASADLDAIACRISGGVACVSVMYFRNGVNLGSRDFFPKLPHDADIADVLTSFIAQYYVDKPVPRELIVEHALPDAQLLAHAFTEQAGHEVEIKHSVRAERARFLELAAKNAEAALATRLASNETQRERFESLRELLGLDEMPQRLECFDISHTMGEATVASCVVYGPEGPVKAQYRRYNITGIEPGDDYAAMRQALERRFRRAAEVVAESAASGSPASAADPANGSKPAGEPANLPDILLIDGGKGQVKQALDVLADLAIAGVLIVGVAKGVERRAGHETLILGASGKTLWPGPESPALHLIQAVRDEAHRFAITGHRKQRQKARDTSRLEDIAGVGAKRRSALLKHFGGLPGVVNAGIEEIAQVKGMSRDLAEKIYALFHS